MNWLLGTPSTVKPRSRYSSCSASSPAYWGVSPQRLATLTTRATRPSVRAPTVVGLPCSVDTGTSRRSLMAAASARRNGFIPHGRPTTTSVQVGTGSGQPADAGGTSGRTRWQHHTTASGGTTVTSTVTSTETSTAAHPLTPFGHPSALRRTALVAAAVPACALPT